MNLLTSHGGAKGAPVSATAPNFTPGDENILDRPVVAHEDESGKELFHGRGALAAHRNQGSGAQIEDEKVGRFACLQTSGLLIERKRSGAAESGEIPKLHRRKRDALHLLHFVRV